jgi:ribonuclease G
MTREILVNVTPREVRAALLEAGQLQEIYIERSNRRGIVGNLYQGEIARVLPGMQAAFVDIGLERTGFLHASDISRPQPAPGADAGAAEVLPADINLLVTQGDKVLVQVMKDPLGSKGARLTTLISLPSRFLVYTPHSPGIGISGRIGDELERERLRTLVRDLATSQPSVTGGYIVRTAAEGAPREALAADMLYLARLWEHVRQRSQRPNGKLVHEEPPLPVRMLRDELGPDVTRVMVDSPAEYARMCGFADAFIPGASARIELHRSERPLFDLHGIEDEIDHALERKVALKSGGTIVIDQTESMTTVDVNTGAFVGGRNLEDTSFRTNIEAAGAIARQLRLRNLGGIIIIDFIDMEDAAHREQLMAAFHAALAGDRAQNQIVSVSTLGLVEMTRKRTRESLEHLLCESCPNCEGRGFQKSAESVCHDIYREVLRQGRQYTLKHVVVLAHPDVVEMLLDEEAEVMSDLESQLGKPIRLQSEAQYDIHQYDVVLT